MIELLITIILSSIPIMMAASGELIVERSGVLNLGVEGMMLMGAVIASIVVINTGNPYLGVMMGALSGVLTSILFAFFSLYLATNQVATGLALTIFGIGLSSMIGKNYIGTPIQGLNPYFFVALSTFIVGSAWWTTFLFQNARDPSFYLVIEGLQSMN